jgi:hypothetical protein
VIGDAPNYICSIGSALVSIDFSNLATIFHYKKNVLDLEKHL